MLVDKIEFQIKKILFSVASEIKRPKAEQKIPSRIDHILVVRLDGLGDALLTLPMLEDIKKTFDNAKIHILASTKNEKLFLKAKAVDNVYRLNFKSPAGAVITFIKIRPQIIRNNYDLIINPVMAIHNLSLASAIVCFLSGKGLKIGFNLLKQGFFYDWPVETCSDIEYEALANLRLSKAIGGSGNYFLPRFEIDASKLEDYRQLLIQKKKEWGVLKIAVMHLGASQPKWCWSWNFRFRCCADFIEGSSEMGVSYDSIIMVY